MPAFAKSSAFLTIVVWCLIMGIALATGACKSYGYCKETVRARSVAEQQWCLSLSYSEARRLGCLSDDTFEGVARKYE